MNKQVRVQRLTKARSSKVADASPAQALVVPDIITFVTSPEYLDRPRLYPLQALLLKVIFLAVDLFTDRDREVLARWGAGFIPAGELGARHFEGSEGMPPDVLARIDACRAQGRRWFREVVLVMGRRGSKGYVTALATAYVVWHYLALDDPQGHYGIESTKRLTGMVFAGDHSQAAGNLFRDVARLISHAPCFKRYVAANTKHALYLCSPRDLNKHQRPAKELVAEAGLVIDARPTTGMSGRGPAAFLALFDEYAHLGVDTVRSADEVYEGAVPALDQFGVDGFIVQASSPASQLGKFYASYEKALALSNDDTAVDPTLLTVQLPSWALYEGWELTAAAEGMPTFPGGPDFMPLTRPIIAYDDAMRRAEQANPAVFAVERRAQWRTSMDAFLAPDVVAAVFAPFTGGEELTEQHWGKLGTEYVMHVDMAKTRANLAVVVGHVGRRDDRGLPHVVIDAFHVRRPGDGPGGEIDQMEAYQLIQQLIVNFAPAVVTFDQFQSALTIQRLQRWAATQHLPRAIQIFEETATTPHNRLVANVFKSAALLGLVHAPEHPLARMELLHLQERNGRVDHPTYGPVTTSDVADALFEVTHRLVGGDIDVWKQLGDLPLGMSQEGGFQPSTGPMPSSGPTPWTEPIPGLGPNMPRPSGGLSTVRFPAGGGAPRQRRWR